MVRKEEQQKIDMARSFDVIINKPGKKFLCKDFLICNEESVSLLQAEKLVNIR
jgi:hypothetical protein